MQVIKPLGIFLRYESDESKSPRDPQCMKISNLKKNSDYSVLKQWCITICDYLLSIDSEFLNLVYGKYGVMEVIDNIDKTHNLIKMKALYKEINILVGEGMLSQKQMDDLNQLLKEKFSHNIADEKDIETDIIQKIIKRGKIRNDREYELVKRREEEVYQDDRQADYADTLRSLMIDYGGA